MPASAGVSFSVFAALRSWLCVFVYVNGWKFAIICVSLGHREEIVFCLSVIILLEVRYFCNMFCLFPVARWCVFEIHTFVLSNNTGDFALRHRHSTHASMVHTDRASEHVHVQGLPCLQDGRLRSGKVFAPTRGTETLNVDRHQLGP